MASLPVNAGDVWDHALHDQGSDDVDHDDESLRSKEVDQSPTTTRMRIPLESWWISTRDRYIDFLDVSQKHRYYLLVIENYIKRGKLQFLQRDLPQLVKDFNEELGFYLGEDHLPGTQFDPWGFGRPKDPFPNLGDGVGRPSDRANPWLRTAGTLLWRKCDYPLYDEDYAQALTPRPSSGIVEPEYSLPPAIFTAILHGDPEIVEFLLRPEHLWIKQGDPMNPIVADASMRERAVRELFYETYEVPRISRGKLYAGSRWRNQLDTLELAIREAVNGAANANAVELSPDSGPGNTNVNESHDSVTDSVTVTTTQDRLRIVELLLQKGAPITFLGLMALRDSARGGDPVSETILRLVIPEADGDAHRRVGLPRWD